MLGYGDRVQLRHWRASVEIKFPVISLEKQKNKQTKTNYKLQKVNVTGLYYFPCDFFKFIILSY